MAAEQNYYQLLKVSKEARAQEVKRVYHELARKFHPDKANSPEEQQRFEEEFALISKAYTVLKDSARRAEYDATLKAEKKREQADREKGVVKPSTPSAAAKSGRANIAQRAYTKGMQLFQAEEYERAVEFFEAAIKNNADEAVYYIKLSIALIKSRRSFTRAVECAQRACELDSYNLDYKLALADIYETVGSRSLALKQVEAVLKWDATHEKALARQQMLMGNDKKSFFENLLARFRK